MLHDFLFEYHTSVLAGGKAQISFLQSKNDVNLVSGQETEIPIYVFRRKINKSLHHILDKFVSYRVTKALHSSAITQLNYYRMGTYEGYFTT